MSDHSFTVQLDLPFKDQPLKQHQKQKLLELASEKEDMKTEWMYLLRAKLREIAKRAEEDLQADDAMSVLGKRRLDNDKYTVYFDSDISVMKHVELVKQCIISVVDDAKRDGRRLPWFDLVPTGVWSCLVTKTFCKEIELELERGEDGELTKTDQKDSTVQGLPKPSKKKNSEMPSTDEEEGSECMVCHESEQPRGEIPGVCNWCAAPLVPKFVSFLRVRMPNLVRHYCCSPEIVNTLKTDSSQSIKVYRLFQEFYNTREHQVLLAEDILEAEEKLREMKGGVGSAEKCIDTALQRRITKVELAKQALQNSLNAKPGELGDARDPKWGSIYMGRFGEKWP